jgi:phospholipid/cholesterol/gamma-HCH transport system ATP-binding protein
VSDTPALEFVGVVKQYGALRPLRMAQLIVLPGSVVAVKGLDAAAAETFINLATGATLPDEGEVRIFGRSTAAVTDPDEWITWLDRFGIVTDRAVLLEDLTIAQNIAMTLSLDVDPMDDPLRSTVATIAELVGIPPALLDRKIATLGPLDRARVRLGRAVALEPAILLLEHPSATLEAVDAATFAGVVREAVAARQLSAIALTVDAAFASAITSDVRTHVPATGELTSESGTWARVRRLFGR